MRQICLCSRCLRDYITAGYTVKRDWSVKIKDNCEICDKTGWTYWIEEVWQKTMRAASTTAKHGRIAVKKY